MSLHLLHTDQVDHYRHWLSYVLTAVVIFLTLGAVRRRYLSSLSSIPGPFFASFTRLWHAYRIVQGDHNTAIIELHQKHGHFVRIAPNEVSVSHPEGPRLLLQTLLRKVSLFVFFF